VCLHAPLFLVLIVLAAQNHQYELEVFGDSQIDETVGADVLVESVEVCGRG